MKEIRAFIAINLPETVQVALGQVNEALATQIPAGVRWVRPELMHLTMRFLGNAAVSQLPRIYEELDRATAAQQAFTLYLDGLGCFPNRRRPRVIWVGLKGDLDAAHALKRRIDTSLALLGWEPEDRPFRAHLTLGRVKDSRKLRGIDWGVEVEALAVPVTAVHLIESELTRSGPIYTVRHTSRLKA